MKYLIFAAAWLCACRVHAGDNPAEGQVGTALATVTVTGSTSEVQHGDTAAMTVVRHDDIVRHGDRTLVDVLKRLPGISIGPGSASASASGAEIRLRGLGAGYTQLLVDGAPVPAGFAVDTIAPELIERIDIMRAAGAAYSAQSMAGAINIVLKKAVAPERDEVKLGLARQHGQAAPDLAWQLSGRDGRVAYTLAATAARTRTVVPSVTTEAGNAPRFLRITRQEEIDSKDSAALAPRLSWQMGADQEQTLTWQSYLGINRIANRHPAQETSVLGLPTEYPLSMAAYRARGGVLRSDVQWTRALADGASIEFKLGINGNWRHADFQFDGADADGQPLSQHRVASGPREHGASLSSTWRQPLGTRHTVSVGWDGARQLRAEYRREAQVNLRQVGPVPAAASADAYRASVTRLAWFAQDEWQLSPRASLALGLRWESLGTHSAGNLSEAVGNRTQVWSPNLQSLYKLTGSDQMRLAVTRTYKAPPIQDLIPRRYAVDNGNSATRPDTQGNPTLRPELAWGLDAGYERDLGQGVMLSASVCMRRISDVTITRLQQRDGVWLSMPVNDGEADVRGLELEAKVPLSVLSAGAPALSLHANLTRNWSHVHALAGPDNRLARQTPLSANIGVDYRPRGAALALGGNLTYQGSAALRESALLASTTGPKRELDLYAVWTWFGGARLRLAVANLLHRDERETERYVDNDNRLLRRDVTTTGVTWRLSLEQRF